MRVVRPNWVSLLLRHGRGYGFGRLLLFTETNWSMRSAVARYSRLTGYRQSLSATNNHDVVSRELTLMSRSTMTWSTVRPMSDGVKPSLWSS